MLPRVARCRLELHKTPPLAASSRHLPLRGRTPSCRLVLAEVGVGSNAKGIAASRLSIARGEPAVLLRRTHTGLCGVLGALRSPLRAFEGARRSGGGRVLQAADALGVGGVSPLEGSVLYEVFGVCPLSRGDGRLLELVNIAVHLLDGDVAGVLFVENLEDGLVLELVDDEFHFGLFVLRVVVKHVVDASATGLVLRPLLLLCHVLDY